MIAETKESLAFQSCRIFKIAVINHNFLVSVNKLQILENLFLSNELHRKNQLRYLSNFDSEELQSDVAA